MRKVCKKCGGRKKVMDLGYMFKTCEECGGIGYLEVDELIELAPGALIPGHMVPAPITIKNAETHGDIELDIEKPKKRRGRPPKNPGKDL